MGLLFDRNMFRNCVRASHPAQRRPGQRIFSFVFWEGGKGKGGGDQAGGSEESASRKNPGKLGHRVMALSMSPTQAPGIPTFYSSFVFFCGCPVYTTTTTTTTTTITITLIL